MSTSAEVAASEETEGLSVVANARLAAGLGVASSALGLAYFARAVGGGGFIDVVATLIFAIIGIHQLHTVFDARIPLLTADDTMVRIRLGGEWLGLPWSTIEQIIVEHRDGRIRDGRLTIVPQNLGDALDALPPRSRRAVAWQARLHGASLTVPLSIATECRGVSGPVEEALMAFSRGRADIQVVGAPQSPVADVVEPSSEVHLKDREPVSAVEPTRGARPVNRAEIIREKSRPVPGVAEAMRVVADVVTPINTPRVETPRPGTGVVAHERVSAVAYPVIGPLVRAARERTDLTIDELSERTMIRPHVLEGVEEDDFSPCGGDFYARGHLRTLARFLGLNPSELTALYDENYAQEPISARRVFEAELATSLGSGVRARRGGPRWSMIAAAVLAVLMVWSIARFLAPESAPVNTATLAGAMTEVAPDAGRTPITSPLMKKSTVTLGSLAWSTEIVVKTVARAGHPAKVVWQGALKSRETKTLIVRGPFTISASQATLTTVSVNGVAQGKVGTVNGQGSRAFR